MTFNYEEIASLDYFDSRDVVEQIIQINAVLDDPGGMWPHEKVALRLERLVLHTLLEELERSFPAGEWSDVRTDTACGVQGFAAHYAEEYAEEYAADVTCGWGATPEWPFNHIDWAAAAEDLKEDYTEVEILGHTFYLRD